MSTFDKLFVYSNKFYKLSSFSSRKELLKSLAINLEDGIKDSEFSATLEQLLSSIALWKDKYGQKMEQFAGIRGLPKSKIEPVQILNSIQSFDTATLPTIKSAALSIAETASLKGLSNESIAAWTNISRIATRLADMCDKQMNFISTWTKENAPSEQTGQVIQLPEQKITGTTPMGSVKDRAQNLAAQLMNLKGKLFPEGDKPVPVEAERRGLLSKADGIVKQLALILKSTYKGPLNDAARKIAAEALDTFYIDLTYDDLQLVPSLENGRLLEQKA